MDSSDKADADAREAVEVMLESMRLGFAEQIAGQCDAARAKVVAAFSTDDEEANLVFKEGGVAIVRGGNTLISWTFD